MQFRMKFKAEEKHWPWINLPHLYMPKKRESGHCTHIKYGRRHSSNHLTDTCIPERMVTHQSMERTHASHSSLISFMTKRKQDQKRWKWIKCYAYVKWGNIYDCWMHTKRKYQIPKVMLTCIVCDANTHRLLDSKWPHTHKHMIDAKIKSNFFQMNKQKQP